MCGGERERERERGQGRMEFTWGDGMREMRGKGKRGRENLS